MRLRKSKAAAAVASGITIALVAAACGSGGTENEGGTQNGTAGPEGSAIADAQRVGAMDDFEVGTTFQATEPFTLDMAYMIDPNHPVQDDWLIWSALEENQGVTIERMDINEADWTNRLNLLVAAGGFPTVLPRIWPGQSGDWWTGGGLLPVSDYFEYMPHFQNLVEEWGLAEVLETQRQDDGRIYQLPTFIERPSPSFTIAINEDLWAEAGITEDPQTWDELAEALAQVQENTDVEFAYSDRWELMAALISAAPFFGTTAGWNGNVHWWDAENGEFVERIGTDGYRQLIEWFADLRAKGVMDPEFTQADEMAVNMFATGRSAAIFSDPNHLINTLRPAVAETGSDFNVRLLVLPEGPAGHITPWSPLAPGIALNAEVRNSPNFLAILQFIDWLYFSEEGMEFASWGVEGVTFERDAEGNRTYIGNIVGRGRDLDEVPVADRQPIASNFGFQDTMFMQNEGGSYDLVSSMRAPEIREWAANWLDRTTVTPPDPAPVLTETEAEQLATLRTQVADATNAGVAAFILGTRDMADWDAFVNEIKNLGATEVVQVMNEALARG